MSTISPNGIFALDCFDAEMSRRTSAKDWNRILNMRNNSRFSEALPTYHRLISAYFADNIVLNRVVTEAWRFEMLVYTLYLHDQRQARDPRSGLTLSNLQRICAQQNCASSGRVFAIVGIMRVGGYLQKQKSARDSRVMQLQPSDKFIEIVEGWNRRIFEIIDTVYPLQSLVQHHTAHPRFGWEMRRRGAEHMLKGWKLLDPFPEVAFFVSSDGGWMLLLHCVVESFKSDRKKLAPVSLDLVEFGRKFGVSRSHLRRLLESAHSEGLFNAPPRNGANIQLAPHLVASFLSCMASELDNYREWAGAAAIELGLLSGGSL